MILPDKSITLSYSIVGIGANILTELKAPQTISSLWERARKYEEIKTYGIFILSLDFLYALGLLEFENGIVRRGKA